MPSGGLRRLRVRNGRRRIAGGYRAASAQQRAVALSRKPRVGRKLVPGNALWRLVIDRLGRGLSPEQIAGTLARMPDPVRLSHETIDTALYAMPHGRLRAPASSPCCAERTSAAGHVPPDSTAASPCST